MTTAPHNFYPRSPCGERLGDGLGDAVGAAISIHALLAESDLQGAVCGLLGSVFLSTLSLRRATLFWMLCLSPTSYFYPRSPCGERPRFLTILSAAVAFLSTLSLRRATIEWCDALAATKISIHALLAESDYDTSALTKCQVKFLSTLSLRRATVLLL